MPVLNRYAKAQCEHNRFLEEMASFNSVEASFHSKFCDSQSALLIILKRLAAITGIPNPRAG